MKGLSGGVVKAHMENARQRALGDKELDGVDDLNDDSATISCADLV